MEKISTGNASGRILDQLETLRLQAEGPGGARATQFAEAATAIQSALQEVEAVEAELTRQNEELVAAREALEVERHRYEDLFALAPDAYLVTDAHGTMEEANRAAAWLFNVADRTLYRKPMLVFVDPGDRPGLRSLLGQLAPGQRVVDVELRVRARDVGRRVVLATVVRDDLPGRPGRLLWILRDITERRLTEEALRESEERLRHSNRLESIGRLAGGIAHSFNNLLAAIAFHTGLLVEALPYEGRLLHHAREIQQAGERAAALARQLLAFGRKQVLQARPLSLNQVITDMEPMLRRLLGEHVRVETRLTGEDCTVCADLGQLEQVVLNLVLNARDAMPDGGRLTLTTERQQVQAPETAGVEDLPAGSYVSLAVGDTGAGIPPDALGHIFEPFFTTKERGKGTGLGLATVHGIARQSGGSIKVDSRPGEGSTFTLLLPWEEGAEAAELAAVEPWPGTGAVRGAETVLLVEDEDNIREPAAEILESRGYTVLPAGDATQALSQLESHPGPIHLLITDIIMPGMTGGQLADQFIRLRPEARVLYISGYPEDALPQGAPQPGRAFLQKPFPPEVLLAAVRDLLTVPGLILGGSEVEGAPHDRP